jgi:hypothetical protein
MAWDTTSSLVGKNDQTNVQTGNQQNTGTTNVAGQYNPAQTALQGQLPSLYQSVLAGNIPQTFTAPQAAIDAYQQQFDAWKAPQLAASGGAGSPMMAANQAMGLSNLMGNLYQSGVGNYNNTLGQAGNLAFQQTGTNQTTAGTQNNAMNNQMNQQFNTDTNQKYQALQDIINLVQQTAP